MVHSHRRDVLARSLQRLSSRWHTPTLTAPARRGSGGSEDVAPGMFVNPIGEGADPSVVRDGERFLWCQAEGNVAVSVWSSDRLTSLGRKHLIWRAEPEGPCSKEVWAPELIRVGGRWHIYFAASDGQNRNHRTFVLVADGDDPLGSYTLHGPMFTGAEPGGPNLWSIDFTVLEHGSRRYGVWSGWPDPDTDLQHLYAAELTSPTETTGGRVRIAEAGLHQWERIEETSSTRGLLEGPRVLQRGARTFLLYSCAASWLPTYKLGMLELTGGDPLDPAAWTPSPEPVFAGTESTYGVGHGAFVDLGEQWWHVFHSKIDPEDGWRRTVHVQPMTWDGDGAPVLGQPLPRGAVTPRPPGGISSRRREGGDWQFGPETLEEFDYYGHHQFFRVGPEGLDLGVVPDAPVNDFRSGEKVVLRDGDFTDVEAEATFSFRERGRAVGVLVRVTGASVGLAAQRGYFAGLGVDRRSLVIGKTDGERWTVLAERPLGVDRSQPQTVTVRAVGDRIAVESGGALLEVRDADYTRGSVGVRVVDNHIHFSRLTVRPLVGS